MEPKLKVGDILVSTFGYDARIATFSKVLARTAKSLKIVRLIDHDRSGNWDDGTDSPSENSRHGEVLTKRVKEHYRGGECINDGYGTATLWDGNPVRTYNHH